MYILLSFSEAVDGKILCISYKKLLTFLVKEGASYEKVDFIFSCKSIQRFAVRAKMFVSRSFVFTKSSYFSLEVMSTDPKFC